MSLFSDELVKDPENDLSQLNRLGVTYFHVGLFPISATQLHRLCFPLLIRIRKASAPSRQSPPWLSSGSS
ncbi:hypothetical protein SBA1_50001 [Candidatus Sulfotelmatobacter kueseliae]|uniref:Uncharacterized protein n=1 Tax=Candidatus Sulfotelmatobacter kueseliae TaxID=2042962 RepID=A0A2U3KVG2_9BACT|nr:hypothetical protein SBA1_50001 [Candidatus Sulfotelmatobacter kueseliae]